MMNDLTNLEKDIHITSIYITRPCFTLEIINIMEGFTMRDTFFIVLLVFAILNLLATVLSNVIMSTLNAQSSQNQSNN